MEESIVIAVSDGFGGYGDYLFALTLAGNLKSYYAQILGSNAPKIHIVTQNSGKQKILALKGDQEFGVDVLTPEELKEKVNDKTITVSSIVEGPVFSSGFMNEINTAIASLEKPVPITMVPEYSFSSEFQRADILRQYEYRKKKLRNLTCQNIFYTGLNEKSNEHGILFNQPLSMQAPEEKWVAQLDSKLKDLLLESREIFDYQKRCELFFQYSHDQYPTTHSQTAARRFLEVHRQFVKSSDKSQDVLMVGKNKAMKKQALQELHQQLIQDGFKKISFLNSVTGVEDVLYDSGEVGKTYRAIYSPGMPHTSMLACIALSGDLIGATGDQSFGEALTANKMIVYECLKHKTLLEYDYQVKVSERDPELNSILYLLSKAALPVEYDQLGALLTPQNVARLKTVHQNIRQDGMLVQLVGASAAPLTSIFNFLQQDNLDPYDKTYMLIRGLLEHTVEHDHKITNDAGKTLCRMLTGKSPDGKEYLNAIRQKYPHSEETKRASYLVAKFKLAQYKPRTNSKREKMFDAFLNMVSTFNTLHSYDENALIGLMLLTTKNIANEYRVLSPEKGRWFGSKLYSTLKSALASLDVDLDSITLEQRQEYYSHLSTFIKNNPQFLPDKYILKSLNREAHIKLPTFTPLLTEKQARKIITAPRPPKDPTVIKIGKYVYKRNLEPLGQGGWSKVYAARAYTVNTGGKLLVSQPLAIKTMPSSHGAILDKEMRLFHQACPGQHFKRFNKEKEACLAMPLFPGMPFDTYLAEHPSLSQEERTLIAMSMLKSLNNIHINGVIHNDLKPKNMLYDPANKEVHIIDFGCAEDINADSKFRHINTAKFAIEYIPPEYIHGCNASAGMDMYSMSLTLGEVLGVDKFALVQERLNKSLATLDHADLSAALQMNFLNLGSLDEALFSPEVSQFHDTEAFKKFISIYTSEKYDFTPYVEQLGRNNVEILNKMQNSDPSLRPSAQEALTAIAQQVGVDLSLQQHEDTVPSVPFYQGMMVFGREKQMSKEEIFSLS